MSKAIRLLAVAGIVALWLVVPFLPSVAGAISNCPDCTKYKEYASWGNGSVHIYQDNYAAQVFTTANSTTGDHDVRQVELHLYRVGNISYTTESLEQGMIAKVSLRTVDSGVISEVDKAWTYIAPSDVTTNSNGQWYAADFTRGSGVYSLQRNTQYAIVLSVPAGDVDHYLVWQYDVGDGDAANYKTTTTDGGANWTAPSTDDFAYRVWGQPGLVIHSALVYSSYKEHYDWLIVCHFNNRAEPGYQLLTDSADWWYIQLIDTSDPNSSTPSYNNSAVLASHNVRYWGDRVGSIYISYDEQESLEWGNSSYAVRLYGYRQAGSPYTDYLLDETDTWRGESMANLGRWCVSAAQLMQKADGNPFPYTKALAGKGVVITEGAIPYFSDGIPESNERLPDFFEMATAKPSPTIVDPGDELQGSMQSWTVALGNSTAGNITAIASDFQIDGKLIGVAVAAFAFLGVASSTVGPGYGLVGLVIAIPFAMIGMWVGFIDVIYIAIAALACVWMLVNHLPVFKG